MDQETVIHYMIDMFMGIEVVRPTDGLGAGDTFIYYDPQRSLDPTRRLPFATIVTKDYGDFDHASQLNREGVFRLNVGVSPDTFRALVGCLPSEFSPESADYDFAALDRLLPHPAYARQSWVCVLNPSAQTFDAFKPLLAEAYARAVSQYASRHINAE